MRRRGHCEEYIEAAGTLPTVTLTTDPWYHRLQVLPLPVDERPPLWKSIRGAHLPPLLC